LYGFGVINILLTLLASFFSIGTNYLLIKVTEAKKVYFSVPDVRALVRVAVTTNFKRLSGDTWSEHDVFQTVRYLISDQLSIPINQIEKEHTFVGDLRMD
jgi:hypothetical protein